MLFLGVSLVFGCADRNARSVQRGYTVLQLSQDAINTTEKPINATQLIGGVALTSHDHQVNKLERALSIDNERDE